MKVRDLLSREHAAVRRLLSALECDVERAEGRARAQAAADLRALLPSLERCEELEDIVFDEPAADGGEPDARRREIEALRGEVLYALELADRCPIQRMRALSRLLSENLRAHLETEELQLWPRRAAALDRPADPDLANPLHRREVLREKRLRRGLASIAASFR